MVKLEIFFRFGGIFTEDKVETLSFGWFFDAENAEASCGDINKVFWIIGENDELSWGHIWRGGMGKEADILFHLNDTSLLRLLNFLAGLMFLYFTACDIILF